MSLVVDASVLVAATVDAGRAGPVPQGDHPEYGLFTYPTGLEMTGRAFETLFSGPRRKPESRITQREMGLAAYTLF